MTSIEFKNIKKLDFFFNLKKISHFVVVWDQTTRIYFFHKYQNIKIQVFGFFQVTNKLHNLF